MAIVAMGLGQFQRFLSCDLRMLLLLSRFSRVRLCPIGGSPPGSPVPEILQAKTLEWVAIAFSKEDLGIGLHINDYHKDLTKVSSQ